MQHFEKLVSSMGGFHDAVVTGIDWQVKPKVLEFFLDDVYSNFRGFPEYPGEKKGRLLFHSVKSVEISIDSSNSEMSIYDLEIAEGVARKLTVRLAPGGHVTVTYERAELLEND